MEISATAHAVDLADIPAGHQVLVHPQEAPFGLPVRHVGGLGQSGTDDTDSTARSCGDERSDGRDDEVVDA